MVSPTDPTLVACVSDPRQPVRLLRAASRAFRSGRHTKLPYVRALHDLDAFRITCARMLPYQVDGEYAGESDTFAFESMPRALSVIC